MTGKTPGIDPEAPLEDADDTIDEHRASADQAGVSAEEPDLLFANIDALMDGSEAPAAEAINLDDHPYSGESSSADPLDMINPTGEKSSGPNEGTFIPVNEADEYLQATDEPAKESFTAVDEALAESAETETDGFFDDEDGPTAEIAIPVADTDSSISDRHATIIELGFYGKLPTYGDFIQKRLPRDFINPWHEWLQAGMHACREQDPDGWLTYYLNCPTWCFVLAGGICGDEPVAGVTIPSVDRVGRYFNFTMASVLPIGTEPTVFASARHNWFTNLKNFAISVLDQEMDQDGIDRAITESSLELRWDTAPGALFESDESHSRVLDSDSDGVTDLLPSLLHQLISREHERYGLWWHRGSSQATAQLTCCDSMPSGDTYLDLIMDRDLRQTHQTASKGSEMDYLDELLSD